MKDNFGRIHIFEVKSVNQSREQNVDREAYENKIAELRKCYKQASKLTEQIFYLPIIDKDRWHIDCYEKGEKDTLTKDQFIEKLKKKWTERLKAKKKRERF